MKELQSVLNIVSDGLKTLAKGVEAIAEKVDEVSKSQGPVATTQKKTAKKPTQKAAKKKAVGPETDTDKVLKAISGSKKGVSTAAIMQKTGYSPKKIANIIYRLRKQQKIKSIDKGVYIKL